MLELSSKFKKLKNGLKLRTTQIAPESNSKIEMHEILDTDGSLGESRPNDNPAVIGRYTTKDNEIIESQGNIDAQISGAHDEVLDDFKGKDDMACHTMVNAAVADADKEFQKDKKDPSKTTKAEKVPLLGKSEETLEKDVVEFKKPANSPSKDGEANKALKPVDPDRVQNMKTSLNQVSDLMRQLKSKVAGENSPGKKPVGDTRSREQKLQDAMRSHGQFSGESFRSEAKPSGNSELIGYETPSDTPANQESQASKAFNERVENANRTKFTSMVNEKLQKLYIKKHGEAKHNIIDGLPATTGDFQDIPGSQRIAGYLGVNKQGYHVFKVIGRYESHTFAVKEGLNRKKPEVIRIPSMPTSETARYGHGHLDDPDRVKMITEQAFDTHKGMEENSHPKSHLAFRDLRNSKMFTEKFPKAGLYVEHGDIHPKNYTIKLGTPSNSERRVQVSDKRNIYAGKGEYLFTHNMKTNDWHPASSWLRSDEKQMHRQIFDSVIKNHPKFSKERPARFHESKPQPQGNLSIVKKHFNSLYELLAKSSPDFISGGKADGKSDSQFDAKQLAMGIKIEQEHTKDPVLAREIAKDHLQEQIDKGIPQTYYTDLQAMENKAQLNKGKGSTMQGDEILQGAAVPSAEAKSRIAKLTSSLQKAVKMCLGKAKAEPLDKQTGNAAAAASMRSAFGVPASSATPPPATPPPAATTPPPASLASTITAGVSNLMGKSENSNPSGCKIDAKKWENCLKKAKGQACDLSKGEKGVHLPSYGSIKIGEKEGSIKGRSFAGDLVRDGKQFVPSAKEHHAEKLQELKSMGVSPLTKDVVDIKTGKQHQPLQSNQPDHLESKPSYIGWADAYYSHDPAHFKLPGHHLIMSDDDLSHFLDTDKLPSRTLDKIQQIKQKKPNITVYVHPSKDQMKSMGLAKAVTPLTKDVVDIKTGKPVSPQSPQPSVKPELLFSIGGIKVYKKSHKDHDSLQGMHRAYPGSFGMDNEGVSSALEEAQNKGFKSIYFDGKPVGMSPEQAHTAAVGPYQMGAQTRANLAKLFDRASKRGKDE